MNKKEKRQGLKNEIKKDWWKYLCGLVIIIVYLLPIYVVITSSLKPKGDLTSRLLLPTNLYLDNYMQVFKYSGILNAYKNTAIITIGTLVVVVLFGCLAAYPLARCKDRLATIVRLYILGVMMVPGICMIAGVYSTLVSIKATSTYWGMIFVLSAFFLPLATFMFSNFIKGIPVSLDEAAMVDGASSLQVFFYVIIPQLRPIIVSVVLIQGINAWNEFEYALYLLQKPAMHNITLVVRQYFTGLADINGAAACAVVAILPIIIVYVVLQKYFVEGAMHSAIKG